jgi:hypothetical protein
MGRKTKICPHCLDAVPENETWCKRFEAPIVGPFYYLFEKGPEGVVRYMSLLNLKQQDPSSLLQSVAELVQGNDSEIRPNLLALLESRNWRSHLVGAVALLFFPKDDQLLKALWNFMDSDNMMMKHVSAVVASLIDSSFHQRAHERLQSPDTVPRVRGVLLFLTGEQGPGEEESEVAQGYTAASGWLERLKDRMQEAGLGIPDPKC